MARNLKVYGRSPKRRRISNLLAKQHRVAAKQAEPIRQLATKFVDIRKIAEDLDVQISEELEVEIIEEFQKIVQEKLNESADQRWARRFLLITATVGLTIIVLACFVVLLMPSINEETKKWAAGTLTTAAMNFASFHVGKSLPDKG